MSNISSVRILGERDEQQDRYCMHPIRMNGIEGHLLAVFDGHGGESAAQYCRTCLPGYFHPEGPEDVPNALARAIARLAKEVSASRAGTTLSAVCVLERHGSATIATIGDSPVIVRKQDGSVWWNSQHNVRSNTEERRSAVARGAKYSHGYISLSYDGEGLQLSRALGDASLRKILSDEPEIHTIASPKVIALMTDGIFNDEHTDEETLETVSSRIRLESADANSILAWRMTKCGNLHDNTTIVLWRK
jgi:protein phosphatase 1L